MRKIIEEQKTKLQPFPFIECEDYLLKLKDGNYVVAYWGNGQFSLIYNNEYMEEEVESYVSLKDLGLWKLF